MSKPRFRFNSAGWFFGLWYTPDGIDGKGRPGRYVWVGPYEALEEAHLSLSVVHIGLHKAEAVK